MVLIEDSCVFNGWQRERRVEIERKEKVKEEGVSGSPRNWEYGEFPQQHSSHLGRSRAFAFVAMTFLKPAS